jgi:hypothetical protein
VQQCAPAVTTKVLLVWHLADPEGDAGDHPDNVVKATNSGGLNNWSQLIDGQGFSWLGGRDLNPDNVVQSHAIAASAWTEPNEIETRWLT